MTIPDAVLLNGERVRSLARAARLEAAEMREWTEDLMQDNLQWHREALAILRCTHELARTRARLLLGDPRVLERPNDRSE
jgi:hypothetical protein